MFQSVVVHPYLEKVCGINVLADIHVSACTCMYDMTNVLYTFLLPLFFSSLLLVLLLPSLHLSLHLFFLPPSLKVISTKAVLSGSGLAGMYTDILNLLPKRCSLLLELTHPQPSGLAPRVPGFDFVANAVWPEVVALIDERVSVIFAPGNPDNFYKVTFSCLALCCM